MALYSLNCVELIFLKGEKMRKKWRYISIFLLGALFLFACSTNKEPLLLNNTNAQELVIVLHGFARNGNSMKEISQALHQQGFQICRLNYATIGQSVEEVKEDVFRQINSCIADDNLGDKNQVNFFGHSLGGLLIRAYLAQESTLIDSGKLGRVVMSGTPNKGSEVGDHYRGRWWSSMLGGMSQALGTLPTDFAKSLPEPAFRAGVIAGNRGWKRTSEFFDNANDGLVSVDATKLKNMKDFIVLDVSHASMKRSELVIRQIGSFLKTGNFIR